MNKTFPLFRSLRFRLIASVLSIEIIMLSLLVWNNINIIYTTHTDRLHDTAASMLEQTANTAGNYMMAVDYASLEEYLQHVIDYRELAYIVVLDRDNNTVIALGKVPKRPWPHADSHPAEVSDGMYDVATDIKVANLPMGRLLMGFSLSSMDNAIRKSRNRGISIAAVEILLTIIVTVLIGLGLTRRLSVLANAAAEVESGNYTVNIPTAAGDEIGKTAHAFNKMVTEIGCRTQQLKQAEAKTHNLLNENRKLVHASLVIQEQERKHLSLELHDEMGQCLTAIQADAEIIRDLSKNKNERIETSAMAIMQVSSRVYDVVHSMMRRLRPDVLDNLGLIEALKDEITAWNSRNKAARCLFNYSGGMQDLNENTGIMLYRIVQEALTNVSKHSHADHVYIELHQRKELLQLTIRDNGKGERVDKIKNKKGLGLIGMRERVETINGHINIESDTGKGFLIGITVPVKTGAEKV